MPRLGLPAGCVQAVVRFLAAGSVAGAARNDDTRELPFEAVKTSQAPILLILDGLDPRTPQELLEVFQLIKANADFPNIIYLTLCDRSIVEANIKEALNVPGRDYLEKIVQVAFDVPMIDVERVRNVLFDRLNRLL